MSGLARIDGAGGRTTPDRAGEASIGRRSGPIPRLSVVTPCFNEQASLHELHARVSRICRECVGESWELVLVNDGSKDATWTGMSSLASTDPRVVAINLSRNFGHQIALSAGLEFALGERILILDADLQDPPELLRDMMVKMDAGADIVYGQRTDRLGETRFKRRTASIFYRLLRTLVDIDVPLDTGDFRLMSRKALNVLISMPEHHRFIRGMVAWIGLRQEPVEYTRAPRFAGQTGYSVGRMIRLSIDAMTGFSVLPLRLASLLGLVFGIIGMFLILYVFGSWVSGSVVAGWTSLITVVLIIGSVQLLVLGIMGEYVGRLYIESKRRPLFVINEVLATNDE